MISAEDAKKRIMLLGDNLNIFREQSTLFQQKTRSTDELQRTKREMEEKLGKLETQERDAESAAETYDREFLDRKADQPDPFIKDKFYTLQDKTLYIFWIAYALLTSAILVSTFLKTKSIKTTLYSLLYLSIAALLIFGIIFKYA